VQLLHDTLAQNGDKITLPAGTFTWSTPVAISKAIKIQGGGIDVTTIVDNVPKIGGAGSVALTFNTSSTGAPRATGFTMRGMAPDTNQYNKGTLVINGLSHSVRVDHIKFDEPGTGAMIVSGDIWGVIDHCVFNDTNIIGGLKEGVQVFSQNWGGGTYGDVSFEQPVNLGSGEGIYIEDNTFFGSGIAGGGVTDSTQGGRFVFRYNNVTSDNAATHGTQGQRYRGVRSYEFYNNTFTNPNSVMGCAIYLRGGTGVIWGNTFKGGNSSTGYSSGIVVANYRSVQSETAPPWGWCNGSNPWDGNTDSLGYPALDQVGRGTCADQIRGDPPINQRTGTAAWPRNASEPLYVWSNSWTPVVGSSGSYIGSQQPVIQAGRDYIDNRNTPMPGYTPYIYPHPLVSR
jgi:hypothetical protein